MNRPMLQVDARSWEPFPIADAQKLDGDPAAGVQWLHVNSAEQPIYYAGLWRAERSRFRWDFDVNETAHILEGYIRVTDVDTGAITEYHAGQAVFFAKGSRTIWEIVEPLIKLFVDSAS